MLIGPWGAHTQPHTGHAEGNVRSDWAALFAVDRTDPRVVQLSFDGDLQATGSCAVGQVCAVAAADVCRCEPVDLMGALTAGEVPDSTLDYASVIQQLFTATGAAAKRHHVGEPWRVRREGAGSWLRPLSTRDPR